MALISLKMELKRVFNVIYVVQNVESHLVSQRLLRLIILKKHLNLGFSILNVCYLDTPSVNVLRMQKLILPPPFSGDIILDVLATAIGVGDVRRAYRG